VTDMLLRRLSCDSVIELYDLHTDPAELHNRIDDANAGRSSSLAGVLAQLKERLVTFYLETCDVVPHDADLRS